MPSRPSDWTIGIDAVDLVLELHAKLEFSGETFVQLLLPRNHAADADADCIRPP
jgi:hypothetical protein